MATTANSMAKAKRSHLEDVRIRDIDGIMFSPGAGGNGFSKI
jgi:hypothetical protein